VHGVEFCVRKRRNGIGTESQETPRTERKEADKAENYRKRELGGLRTTRFAPDPWVIRLRTSPKEL